MPRAGVAGGRPPARRPGREAASDVEERERNDSTQGAAAGRRPGGGKPHAGRTAEPESPAPPRGSPAPDRRAAWTPPDTIEGGGQAGSGADEGGGGAKARRAACGGPPPRRRRPPPAPQSGDGRHWRAAEPRAPHKTAAYRISNGRNAEWRAMVDVPLAMGYEGGGAGPSLNESSTRCCFRFNASSTDWA